MSWIQLEIYLNKLEISWNHIFKYGWQWKVCDDHIGSWSPWISVMWNIILMSPPGVYARFVQGGHSHWDAILSELDTCKSCECGYTLRWV